MSVIYFSHTNDDGIKEDKEKNMKFNNRLILTTPEKEDLIKAPEITKEEFKEILADYYNLIIFDGDATEFPFEGAKKDEFVSRLYQRRLVEDIPGFFTQMDFVTDDPLSTVLKSNDSELSILGVQTLSNNVPIYGFIANREFEIPYVVILYWNGSSVAMYIPEAGNTINSDFYTPFGNESYTSENPHELVESYESFLKKALDEIKCSAISADELEFMQPGIAYCLKHGYADNEEEAYQVMNTVSWDLIISDILNTMEVVDEEEMKEIEEEEEENEEEKEEFDLEEDKEEDEECFEEDSEEDTEDDSETSFSYLEEESESLKEEDDEDVWSFSLEEKDPEETKSGEEEATSTPKTKSKVIGKITIPEYKAKFTKLEIPAMTTETDFCNNKRSMISIGRVSIPVIKPEKFKEKIDEYYDTLGIYVCDYHEDPTGLINNLMMMDPLNIEASSGTMKNKGSKLISNEGESLLGFHVLPNGIPFLGLEAVEEDSPVFVVALWDGNQIVPYVPVYGNTFNADLGTLFGKERFSARSAMTKKIYLSKHGIKIDPAHEDEELRDAYLTTLGHHKAEFKKIKRTCSWKALLEDLYYSITAKH